MVDAGLVGIEVVEVVVANFLFEIEIQDSRCASSRLVWVGPLG